MDFNFQTLVWIIAEVGALNWGLVELANVNLVTELLGSGSELAGVVYVVIGLAGALALAEKTGAFDLEEFA
jgi:uncharacterized membrane protein YuzA (DUF378 family)